MQKEILAFSPKVHFIPEKMKTQLKMTLSFCRRTPFTSNAFAIFLFVFLLYSMQVKAESFERGKRSNQIKNPINEIPNKRSIISEETSNKCTEHLENWMRNISTTAFKENATLVVDWSDLDKLLTAKNCPYDQLWIELWRVNDDRKAIDGTPDGNALDGKGIPFGSREYFETFDRCNQLDDAVFAFHSTRAHDRRSSSKDQHLAIKADSELGYNDNNQMTIDPFPGPLAMQKLDPDYSTKTTFLHVVEKSYILRLCPCGKVRKERRVCDCEYTSALCSGIISINQPDDAKVFDWCKPTTRTGRNEKKIEMGNQNKMAPQLKVDIQSPIASCDSVNIGGNLDQCTPVQKYDRVKVSTSSLII